MRTRRRPDPAQLAARLQAHVDDWAGHAPPRRPRLGHTADCPDNARPMPRSGRCRHCRAEALEAHGTRPAAGVVQALIASHPDRPSHPGPAVQEHACPRCYRPTTDDICDRCQPGGTT